MKRIINYFNQGLLYIVPLSITIYIIYVTFIFVDNLLNDILLDLLGVHIPGLGLIIIVLFLILAGLIGQTVIARPFKALYKRILDKAPLLKFIYSSLSDLFSAFVGKERKFNKPVLVLVNEASKLEKLGFLTDEDLSKFGEKEKVAVYFPHSYNFSGELFIVPKSHVKPLDLKPADVMKFIISAGVASWEEKDTPSIK